MSDFCGLSGFMAEQGRPVSSRFYRSKRQQISGFRKPRRTGRISGIRGLLAKLLQPGIQARRAAVIGGGVA